MADLLDDLHEARRLDAQQRREREQRWELPTTAQGWEQVAHRLALALQGRHRCNGPLRSGPCAGCIARSVVRHSAACILESVEAAGEEPSDTTLRSDAHLRAPCIDHDAMPCPDPDCTGAIGDGSHDGAPPTCDACERTWARCIACEAVFDHQQPCPACAAADDPLDPPDESEDREPCRWWGGAA